MSKVVEIWSSIIKTVEPDITFELEEIIYSKRHGHEICVMHLVGKNSFPKMTTMEILSNPKAMAGMSKEDLIAVTRLDCEIKFKLQKLNIVEFDRNGTLTLEDENGRRKSYSETLLSSDDDQLDLLRGSQAYRLGYRIGNKDGLKTIDNKKALSKKILNLFKKS